MELPSGSKADSHLEKKTFCVPEEATYHISFLFRHLLFLLFNVAAGIVIRVVTRVVIVLLVALQPSKMNVLCHLKFPQKDFYCASLCLKPVRVVL